MTKDWTEKGKKTSVKQSIPLCASWNLLQLLLYLDLLAVVLGCQEAQPCPLSDGRMGLCSQGQCLAEVRPEPRQNLRFTITVKYPERNFSNKTSTNLYIRGNGLGLAWNVGTQLYKVAEDTWSINITYQSSVRGYTCQHCSDSAPLLSHKLQYRILINDFRNMKGPNFAITLPVSKASTYFTVIPEYIVYPWFDVATGSLRTFNITSQNIGGKRSVCIYTPPSFAENRLKTYPPILVFDLNYELTSFFKKNLEEPIYKKTSEEYILIGFGDYANETERMNLLTPVVGQAPTCYNGTLENYCDGCIPISENITEIIYYTNKCTYPSPIGGRGNQTLDFLLDEVVPMAEFVTSQRLEMWKLGIMGYSLGGLMACYAAWTRPARFTSAICQSPSLFWPDDSGTKTAAFHFINQTLKNPVFLQNRPRQKFYIDAGSEENLDPYRLTQSAVEVADYIAKRQPYALNDNVWIAVEPGRAHGYPEWGRRMGHALAVVMAADGDPELLGFNAVTNAASDRTFQPCLLLYHNVLFSMLYVSGFVA